VTLQSLYQVAQGTADANGAVTLSFPCVPQGLTWTGSITAAVNPQMGNVVGTSSPAPLFGATWTITVNNVPFMSYQGLEVVNDFQATSRQTVVINGFGLAPGVAVILTWVGYSGYVYEVESLGPSVSGIPGDFGRVFSSGGDIENPVHPSNVTLISKFNNTASSSVIVINFSPSNGKTAYLLAYTLGGAMAQLSTTTGTHGFDASLMVQTLNLGSPVVIDQINICSVPASSMSESVSQNYLAAPLPLGPGDSMNITLVNSASAADIIRSNCSVLVGYV
jgi:hypothetical protein